MIRLFVIAWAVVAIVAVLAALYMTVECFSKCWILGTPWHLAIFGWCLAAFAVARFIQAERE